MHTVVCCNEGAEHREKGKADSLLDVDLGDLQGSLEKRASKLNLKGELDVTTSLDPMLWKTLVVCAEGITQTARCTRASMPSTTAPTSIIRW